ncbi:MAG: uridine kinase [Oscillospiraceae bacterium]|nr:uridine kinase [Oscillospiraceae bacterium]
MAGVITIGVAGGTGSGKTTITKRIVGEFAENVTVIMYDNYYKAHDDLTYEQRSALNYDHPDAFDTELFLQHLQMLKEGKTVEGPTYDFTVHNRSSETITLKPAPVIVVEGILIFASKEICDLLDIKLFVDTDADERIVRRILRDVKSRGRTLESVTEQYLTTVKPMHEQFVQPSMRRADIVVLGGGHNLVALEMIFDRIRSHLVR